MGTTYTTTIQIRCWKEHTCVGCQAKYAYLFARTVKGQGSSAAASSAAAEASVVSTVKNQVDMHPCPTCGVYQPDMIGAWRVLRHWSLFWGSLVLFGLLLILYAAEVMSPATVCYATAGVCAVAALGHALAGLRNPNANLEANKATAQQTMQKHTLQQSQGGSSEAPAPEAIGASTGGVWLAVGLLGVAAVLALLPEGLRNVNGWPMNDELYPPVVGPGEETKVYFPQKISSIEGYWRGNVKVTAMTTDRKSFELPARTKQDNWGQSIYAEPKEKGQSLWVTFRLPPGPELTGKKLQVQIQLEVTYPKLIGKDNFEPITQSFKRTTILEMASAGAGAQYLQTWWIALLGAMGLSLAATGFLIARAYAAKKRALPTAVYAAN